MFKKSGIGQGKLFELLSDYFTTGAKIREYINREEYLELDEYEQGEKADFGKG